MEILYCDGCGLRISDADLRSGVAVRDSTAARAYCPKCAPASRPTKIMVRPSSGENVIHRPSRATPVHNRVPASGAQRTAPAAASADVKASDASTKLMIGGGVAGVLGLVLIVFAMRGGKKDTVSKVEPKDSPSPTVIKPVLERPKPAELPPVVNIIKHPPVRRLSVRRPLKNPQFLNRKTIRGWKTSASASRNASGPT
jgi:hypothetical protein